MQIMKSVQKIKYAYFIICNLNDKPTFPHERRVVLNAFIDA